MKWLLALIVLIAVGAFLLSRFTPEVPSEREARDRSKPAAAAPEKTPASEETLARMREIAQRTGVGFEVVANDPGRVHVRVGWRGAVAGIGGDFVLALVNAGIIRDFDAVGEAGRGYDAQGRSVWRREYVLELK